MSSQSITSVCNISLAVIGAQAQISSLTEGSTEANACNLYFNFVFEKLARAAWWGALRTQNTLTLIQAATGTPENQNGTFAQPPTPWLYAYEYPSDCLKIRTLVPSNTSATAGTPIFSVATGTQSYVPNGGNLPWAISYGTDASGNPLKLILTNLSGAQAIYTSNQTNPQIWDGSFTDAFVASLAAYLVPTLAGNMQLMQMQKAIATQIIESARVENANEGFTVQDHLPDWVQVRGYSNYATTRNMYGGGQYGLDDMIWPTT